MRLVHSSSMEVERGHTKLELQNFCKCFFFQVVRGKKKLDVIGKCHQQEGVQEKTVPKEAATKKTIKVSLESLTVTVPQTKKMKSRGKYTSCGS